MFQNRKKGKGEGGGERDTWSAGPGRQYKTNIIKYYSASFGSCFSSSFLLTVLLEAPAGGLLQGAPRLGGAHAFRAAPRHLRVKVTVPSCSEEMLSLASTDHFISASCYRFYTILFPDSKFGQKFQRSLQNGVVLFFVAFLLLPLASLLDSLRRSGSVLHAALGRKARSPTFSDTNIFLSKYGFPFLVSPPPEIFLICIPTPPYVILFSITQMPQILIEQGHARHCKGRMQLYIFPLEQLQAGFSEWIQTDAARCKPPSLFLAGTLQRIQLFFPPTSLWVSVSACVTVVRNEQKAPEFSTVRWRKPPYHSMEAFMIAADETSCKMKTHKLLGSWV